PPARGQQDEFQHRAGGVVAGHQVGGPGRRAGAAAGGGTPGATRARMRPTGGFARWGPLATLAVGVAEIVVFVAVGRLLGGGLAGRVVGLGSFAGLLLRGGEGLRAWRGVGEAMVAGRPPGPHVTDGVVGLRGASLLAVPGLVPGVAGALLLTLPVRQLVRSQV